MKRFILLITVVLLGLNFWGRIAFGEDRSVLKMRFDAEYPDANLKLRSFYTNCRILSLETMRDQTEDKIITQKEIDFGGNSDSLRFVVTNQPTNPDSKGASSFAKVVNPRLAFQLLMQEGQKHFMVRSMGPSSPKIFEDYARSIRLDERSHSTPYCFFEIDIAEFTNEKNFRITSIREREESGRTLFRVEWENNATKEIKHQGWFEFDAGLSWALKGYESHLENLDLKSGKWSQLTRHCLVQYEGSRDGVPLLSRVQTWNSAPNGISRYMTTLEIKELRPGSVQEVDFLPQAFGIQIDPAPSPVPIAYYLVAFSVFCGLLVLLFRFLEIRSVKSAKLT